MSKKQHFSVFWYQISSPEGTLPQSCGDNWNCFINMLLLTPCKVKSINNLWGYWSQNTKICKKQSTIVWYQFSPAEGHLTPKLMVTLQRPKQKLPTKIKTPPYIVSIKWATVVCLKIFLFSLNMWKFRKYTMFMKIALADLIFT